jgi:hypothetical protein
VAHSNLPNRDNHTHVLLTTGYDDKDYIKSRPDPSSEVATISHNSNLFDSIQFLLPPPTNSIRHVCPNRELFLRALKLGSRPAHLTRFCIPPRQVGVIFYSTYGHIATMAEAVIEGVKATGVNVKVFQL